MKRDNNRKETTNFVLLNIEEGKYLVKVPNLNVPLQLNEFWYTKLKAEVMNSGKNQ